MRLILALLAAALLIAIITECASADEVGRFDFAKRTTFSVGVDREWHQSDADSSVLGKNDATNWRAGLFGSFRVGRTTSFTGSAGYGLDHHDWLYRLGVRFTIWRGAKTPLDQPAGGQ